MSAITRLTATAVITTNCFVAETQGAQRLVTDRLLRLPKKHVGNGSALADSTPLRLCVSATKQFVVITAVAVSRVIADTAQRSR